MRKSYAELRQEIDYDNLVSAVRSDFSEVPDYRAANASYRLGN